MVHVFDIDYRINAFLVATKRLYKSVCPSVRWSVGPYVMLSLFGLLGATYAVYTALFITQLAQTFCVYKVPIHVIPAALSFAS